MIDLRDFAPEFTRPRVPEMAHLSKEELIPLLPERTQREVRRIDWVYENVDKLAGKPIYDSNTGEPIANKRLTRDDILLLFDPEFIEVPGFSDEENYEAYLNSDPVIWCRAYLSMNPRLYQTLVLRANTTRNVLRFGRRCGKTTTFAIRMLYRSWVNPGNKSLLITPMKSHATVTWDMIQDLMGASPEFQSIMEHENFRMVEQPNYRIKFPNGSYVPDEILTNAGRRLAGHEIYNEYSILADLAGGISASLPTEESYYDPETADLVNKYTQRNPKYTNEECHRCFRMMENKLCSSFSGAEMVAGVHGGGSPIMETLTMMSRYDVDSLMDIAKYLSGINKDIPRYERETMTPRAMLDKFKKTQDKK